MLYFSIIMKFKIILLFLKSIFFLILFSFLTLFCLFFSDSSLVKKTYTHPIEVKNAVENYRYVSKKLFHTKGDVALTLDNTDLQSIVKAASHLIPYLNAKSRMYENEIILSGTLNLSKFISNTYINASCIFKNIPNNLIDSCQIGKLSIPGFLIKKLVNFSLAIVRQHAINDISLQIIENSIIDSNNIYISVFKSNDLKNNIKDDMRSLLAIFDSFGFRKKKKLDYDVIIEYLSQFDRDKYLSNKKNISLGFVFSRAFELAKMRTQRGSEISENAHALFAVAVAFGHRRFMNIIQEQSKEQEQLLSTFSFMPAHINNRYDLTLHFLYSAIFEQMSNEKLAFNVGELKELFDANKGGSQFDFSDLAADIAGARFANFVTSNSKNALQAQNLLTKNASEGIFFPSTINYPRRVNSRDLERMIFSNEENKYAKIVDKIYEDVRNLPLYK